MNGKPKLSELLKETPKSVQTPRQTQSGSKRPRIIPITELNILTEENLILFIKQVRQTKPYELKHRFYNNSSFEIKQLLDKLFDKGLLEKNRNGWIYLKN